MATGEIIIPQFDTSSDFQQRTLAIAKGTLIVGGASGVLEALAVGADDKVLTAKASASGGISWEALSAMTNPMTTANDIIYGGASGVPSRMGIGSDGQVLKVLTGGILGWGYPDALSLAVTKQDVVSTTSETAAVTITLPANSMADGDVLKIYGWYKISRSGTTAQYLKFYVNSTSFQLHTLTGNYGTIADDIYSELALIRNGTSLALASHHRNGGTPGTALFPLNNSWGTSPYTFNYSTGGCGTIFTGLTFSNSNTLYLKFTPCQNNLNDYFKPQGVKAILYK